MGKVMPWTQKVLDLLGSGPQPYEYLIAEAGSLIPPGRAYRETERNRKRIHDKKHSTPSARKYYREPDAIIRTGRRIIISNSILTWVRQGLLVRFVDEDGQQMVRFPGTADSLLQHGIKCNRCGEELFSNSAYDWVGCNCDLPSWVNGGPVKPRVGVNSPIENIQRYVISEKLPRYYRSEFNTDGAPREMRPWIVALRNN